MKPKEMWPRLANANNFYADLDWMPRGRDLWAEAAPHNPTILTGLPMKGAWADKQKRIWCSRELSDQVPVITCMSRDKHTYCDGDNRDVLVDDNAKNCEEWTRAGGIAILYDDAKSDEALAQLRTLFPSVDS